MVAAARFADLYDGYLAGDPGFNLPKAAAAQLYGAQQFASVAGPSADLATAFTPDERRLVARKVLERCDALDGAADGLVQDTAACQRAFDLQRDVPSCGGTRDGTCLTAAQKTTLANVFAGARDSAGRAIYASFPYDAGISGADWAAWKFTSSVTNRDPVAMAYVFQTPPAGPEAARDPKAFALAFPVDRALQLVNATQPPYDESSLSFMTPPHPTDLSALKARGGKMLVYHGTSDPVFSSDDTTAWYEALDRAEGGRAADFVRFFRVPGMNHCSGGPSTDRFDMLQALVDWVEQGQAPEAVIAGVRGPSALPPNAELPAGWSPERTRPLCPYPQVARYKGSGDPEQAENFACR
jgi:feruloyl esterase